MPNPPSVWVHTSRSDAGAGKGIDREMDQKDGDPSLNYPIGTLENGHTSLSPPLPTQWAVAPLFS